MKNVCTRLLALFTHGKRGAAHINVDRSTFYFVFTQHSVWTGLHRHVSALALSGRYTVRCNRADIAVSVSWYNDIEP